MQGVQGLDQPAKCRLVLEHSSQDRPAATGLMDQLHDRHAKTFTPLLAHYALNHDLVIGRTTKVQGCHLSRKRHVIRLVLLLLM